MAVTLYETAALVATAVYYTRLSCEVVFALGVLTVIRYPGGGSSSRLKEDYSDSGICKLNAFEYIQSI